MMTDKQPWPPGQKERADFPRFGVRDIAGFDVPVSDVYTLQLVGEFETFTVNQKALATLERVELAADFHCVTTWSYRGACWSGFRFSDFFEQIVQPQLPVTANVALAVFIGLDRYKASLPLADLLADGVLIADRLNGEQLPFKHGAPLRLVAPAHYGYKNMKHLAKIGLWPDGRTYRKRVLPTIMEHPRARVAFEERGRLFPGWLFRYVYRPLIKRTVRQFERPLQTAQPVEKV